VERPKATKPLKSGRKNPWVPPEPSLDVSVAIKAVAAGTANEHQQRKAMQWIINDLCGTYDMSYRPDSERDTTFAEGKRFVGNQLVKEINISMEILRRKNAAE
jgi:hypothetical protein